MKFTIVAVDEKNIAQHPQVICFINPRHEHYGRKVAWLKKRFREGMKIKLLYLEGEKKPAAFIEYVPGEYAWRAVSAKDYLFIHCILVFANKYKNRGIGTRLLDDCLAEAKNSGYLGVAVVVSSGSFMAKRDLFIKNGFQVVASAGPRHELLAKSVKKGPFPKFNDWQKERSACRGLCIVYSEQCPWVARFVAEIKDKLKGLHGPLTLRKLETPAQAQQAPSPYATFNLIYQGRLLADHYISETRFLNILKKEKLL